MKYKVRPFGHLKKGEEDKFKRLEKLQEMWFIISLKKFYIFKIVKLEIFLKQ